MDQAVKEAVQNPALEVFKTQTHEGLSSLDWLCFEQLREYLGPILTYISPTH